MEDLFLKRVKRSVKHWYLHLIIGIVLILAGILAFSYPVGSYVALTIVFSISFLVAGVLEIVFAITNRKVMENWGWTLGLGILTTLVGLLLVSNPAISAISLPIYIGFMLMFHSFWAIGSAIDIKSYGVHEWGWLLFIGILGVIFSFFLIRNPLFGGKTIIIWTGLALMSSGVFNIYMAMKMRKIHKEWEEMSEATKFKLEEAQTLYLDELNAKKG
ncbi:MAG: HdeD family acid-resistance protein [Mariniphaga sp.]|jgi:uncharacterized membrane protein HdeD (DUF308 family)|nr:HdeD family acid-resistance protein [Mariniphaga sp.]